MASRRVCGSLPNRASTPESRLQLDSYDSSHHSIGPIYPTHTHTSQWLVQAARSRALSPGGQPSPHHPRSALTRQHRPHWQQRNPQPRPSKPPALQERLYYTSQRPKSDITLQTRTRALRLHLTAASRVFWACASPVPCPVPRNGEHPPTVTTRPQSRRCRPPQRPQTLSSSNTACCRRMEECRSLGTPSLAAGRTHRRCT